MILRTWSKGQKRPEAITPLTKKKFQLQNRTYKSTKHYTSPHTRHAPQIKKLFVTAKQIWFQCVPKVFRVFALHNVTVQGIPEKRPTISYGTISKYFFSLVDTIVLSISCCILMYLNVFSEISWKYLWQFFCVVFIHKDAKI